MPEEEQLLCDIRRYFSFLRQCGYRVSISCVDRDLRVLYPVFATMEVHPCALCDFVKAAERRFCLRNKERLCEARLTEPQYVVCPFGVEEYIYPVLHEGRAVVYLHASGYRGRILPTSERLFVWEKRFGAAYRAEYEKLDPLPPDAVGARAVLSPLGYMVSLFYENFVAGRVLNGRYDRIYAGMMDYLYKNYSTDFSMEDMAAALHYSASHLRSVFRRKSGRSFAAFVTDFRLSQAKTMLRTSEKSVADIGRLCGFPDAGHFSVLFRKKYGSSPRQYRRAGGGIR